MSNENKPIHRVRIGNIGAAIFENKNAEGQAFYSVQVNRSYRDGDTWNYTSSFGKDDLLVLAKVSDLAHSFIVERLRWKEPTPETDDQG